MNCKTRSILMVRSPQTACRRVRAASLPPPAYGLLPTASCLRPTASRLLQAVYALLFASYAVSALAQPKPDPGAPAEKDPPAVDQAAVDAAVGKGAEWLRARLKEGLPIPHEAKNDDHAESTFNEIVLYTLLHAGVDRGDPDLIKLVGAIRAKPPHRTYSGSLRAMALAMYDPVKLRPELILNAQFLVDNQGQNGQWGYSRPIPWPPLPKVTFTPSSKPPNYTLSGPAGADGGSPAPPPPGVAPPSIGKSSITQARKTMPKYVIQRRNWGGSNDNSNTQYAILGLKACMASGIAPPPDCLPTTEKWLTEHQNADGGWGYQHPSNLSDPSTGAMTAGGLSSLAACVRGAKNADPRKDPRVQKALQWMAQQLTYRHNANGNPAFWHYYWIYAVERAGAFVETEWFGDHPWYHEGATWLVGAQHADGTWGRGDLATPAPDGNKILDTCWAILFLRRATRHIARQKVYTQ